MTDFQPTIRDEAPGDFEVITQVTIEAFRTLEVSNQTEQFIIKALRDAGALSVSLVAEIDGRVVGHIAFSPVTMSDGSTDWYGLGPISVLPEIQGKGIGRALMEEGLSRLRGLGGRGCVLVGDPNFYRRFGFRNPGKLVLPGVPQEVLLVLPLAGHVPQGEVAFHEGFMARS